MQGGIIILIILFLIFGSLGGDIIFPSISVKEDKITGNERVCEIKDGNDDIYKIFKESVTGNTSVNLSTENGDIYSSFERSIEGNSQINIESKNGNIYVRFKGKITGNINVDIKTNTGDIHIIFEEEVKGNPHITLKSLMGKIVFYNNSNIIKKHNISVISGNIIYKMKADYSF